MNKSISNLDILVSRRTGGAINIQGIYYQFYYSCKTLLDNLNKANSYSVRLEGIEDVDIINQINVGHSTYIQLKYSKNKLSASDLWSRGVIQNYLEVYLGGNTECNFKLAHNNLFNDKNIIAIQNRNKSANDLAYWETKIEELKQGKGLNYDWSNFNLNDFLDKISFEVITIDELHKQIIKQLNAKFKITFGNTEQYIKALFYHIFLWSISRTEVTHSDIEAIINSVSEDIAKGSYNPAIQNRWLERINFNIESQKNVDDYFDGKPARPIHIVQNLPIKRKKWEQRIFDSIQSNDITVIKASSGQGKSTLAWQIAKRLDDNEYSIYELLRCEEEYTGSLIEIIEGKVKNGETVIIVVDGLNNSTSAWAYFAERIQELPVKFIITTREEDWNRYGSAIHKLKVEVVNIGLNQVEAQEIFKLLKEKKKLNSNIQNWQSAWEQVADKQLLIEYIYLLTKGEMLSSRLEEQIKRHRESNNSSAIIEVLNITSLADTCNIKILNSKLTTFLEKRFNDADFSSIYDILEKEYYLKFDNIYVEGLHPIRSKHIVDILHRNYPIKNTFLKLLYVLDENAIYDFTYNALTFIENTEIKEFLEDVTDRLLPDYLPLLIKSLDGCYHFTAQKYWEENRNVFDTVFKIGGLELFVYDTLPFTKLTTIRNLKETIGENAERLIGYLDELPDLDFENTICGLFLKVIKKKLKFDYGYLRLEGFGSLVFWLSKVGTENLFDIGLDSRTLRILFDELENDESTKLASALYLLNPIKYERFITENKEEIFGHLKVKTQSLDIVEVQDDISIRFILDNDKVATINEEGVKRAEFVKFIMPIYQRYCTDIVVPPFFQNEFFTNFLKEGDGHKHIHKDYLPNNFETRLNTIWAKAILGNYQVNIVYEWQKQWIEIRIKSYQYASYFARTLESLIQNDFKKAESIFSDAVKIGNEYAVLQKTTKGINEITKNSLIKDIIEENSKHIRDWCFSFNNFSNQSYSLIKDDNDTKRVAKLNLDKSINRVTSMQLAFDIIIENTYRYEGLTDAKTIKELKEKEFFWYNRLQRVVHFRYSTLEGRGISKVLNIKSDLKEWWNQNKVNTLNNIKEIVEHFEENSAYLLYLSEEIEPIGDSLTNINIGVEVFNFENIDELTLELIQGLYLLGNLDITYFTFILINTFDVYHIGIRIPKYTFEKAEKFIETGEFEDYEFGKPHPVILTDNDIKFLGNVKLNIPQPPEENNIAFEVLDNLWQFDEYRKYTNDNVSIEKEWLKKKKDSIKKINQVNIKKLENVYSFERLAELKKLNNEVLELDGSFKMDKVSFILGVPENTFL